MTTIARTTGALAALLFALPALGQAGQLTIGGTTYTKWLWGTQRNQSALYSFSDLDDEGYGDNGQGTELELLLAAKLSRQVEVKGRIHSRFSQNFWTNFGGFGGTNDSVGACQGGRCGEFDPRSNQYIKLRGMQVILTPGYGWIDSATIGSNDFGMFDPFVIGRVRYIDRDNASGLLFQGSAMGRKVTWDLVRISLPRLWAGPGFTTGTWHASDAAYGGQIRWAPSEKYDVGVIGDYVIDSEIDPVDQTLDDGRQLLPRYRNGVVGLKGGFHPGVVDVRAQGYYSYSNAFAQFAGANYGGIDGFGPVPLGKHEGFAGKVDVTLPSLLTGLALNLEGFYIGADYVSIMAARRESDVLLTEGHDSAFALPGPDNSRFNTYYRYRNGVIGSIGYGGWSGNAQQVATVNVDNEFTDFDEPMAESAIGWVGGTVKPVWTSGPLEVGGEYTYLTYDTNWQAYGKPNTPLSATEYPGAELDAGVHNFRSNYQPFQDKQTQMAVVRAKYVVDFGRGIDLFGKVKFITEKDKRMNDARYLPYAPGTAIGGAAQEYVPGYSTASIYSDPTVIAGESASGAAVTGPAWKPFRDISDDDRNMDYWSFNVGAGYQLFDERYASLTYAKYLVNLEDGNTAFQGYNNLHRFSSGDHDKNQVILNMKYVLAGVEFGFEGQFNFGTFKPDFGKVCTADGQTDCFVLQRISDADAATQHITPGSRGFYGRQQSSQTNFQVWDKQEFENWRLKAFMKAQF
jgi:hypothetical protein